MREPLFRPRTKSKDELAAIVLIDLRLSGRGDSALHAATSNGDLVVAKTLLDAGADANHANKYVGVHLVEGGAVSLLRLRLRLHAVFC
jgi:hypothetical protein